MLKIFITGATGYVGGDVLCAIANAHPELEITALVRSAEKGAKISAQHSNIRLVYGTLESTELIVEEASNADIAINCADVDHAGAASALIKGLSQRASDAQPGYLIHTSGTALLNSADLENKTYGIWRNKVFDDWEGIQEVTSLPDTAIHRNVDKIVLAAGESYPGKINTAIVCPPCIYGPGRGIGSTKSTPYIMTSKVLTRGRGFQVGAGNSAWSLIHVQDLSNIYLLLVESALKGGGNATWNADGYYFAETGTFTWGHVGRAIAAAAYDRGFIKTAEIGSVSPEEADQLAPYGSLMWGTNSRSKAIRARELLGWMQRERSLFDMIPEIVDGEAKALGLVENV